MARTGDGWVSLLRCWSLLCLAASRPSLYVADCCDSVQPYLARQANDRTHTHLCMHKNVFVGQTGRLPTLWSVSVVALRRTGLTRFSKLVCCTNYCATIHTWRLSRPSLNLASVQRESGRNSLQLWHFFRVVKHATWRQSSPTRLRSLRAEL